MTKETGGNFINISKPKNNSPIIISIPHGGKYIPPEFTENLLFPREKLWSDWHTLELCNFFPKLGFSVLSTKFNPYMANLNRHISMPEFGQVVAMSTSNGEPLYRINPDEEEVADRIKLTYTPYHEALIKLVNVRFPRVLVLDMHSFGESYPVDIILGDGHGKTAEEKSVFLIDHTLKSQNLTTVLNEPWSGGWIVKQFTGNNAVDAIQIELNQRLYLNEEDIEKKARPPRLDEEKFIRIQGLLKQAFELVGKIYPKLK